VTGASTADLAIVLLDASKGVLSQSIRHAAVAGLLGIRHVVVAVNKMDLVQYSQARFDELKESFTTITKKLNLPDVRFIPISALLGDMVVQRGENMAWYQGPTLLDFLEHAEVGEDRSLPFRFPVQLVSRPGLPQTYVRGYMGRIESGQVRLGDRVTVLPSGQSSTVTDIVTYDGSLEVAQSPQSITLVLADEIDISRGDLIVRSDQAARVVRQFSAMLCWLDAEALAPGRKYLIKHTTRLSKAVIESIDFRLDIGTLESVGGSKALQMNEIGQVRIKTRDALAVDAYRANRTTGGFILIDEVTHHTVAGGMILEEPGQGAIVG
jgi:sulfate adenylyltransferase subunit 1